MTSQVIAKRLAATCIVSTLLMSGSALAGQGPARAVVTNESGDKVVSTDGNCVRTKWETGNDICTRAKPVKVVQQPPAPKIGLEQRTVFFDFNKAELTQGETAKLDKLVDIIKHTKAITHATVLGYTDDIGKESYNMKLSQKRADTVEQYLAGHVSIPTSVLMVAGKGDANPLTTCPKKMKRKARIECLAQNRRVEIQFDYTE